MLETLIARWGYLAIVFGTLTEGEVVVLAAGAMAHRGLLSLPYVMLAAFVGTLCSDQLWFQIGRRFGRRFVERRPKLRARLELAERWLARFGALYVLGFRFIYGARTASPIFLGISHYPLGRFIVLNAIGAALWAAVLAALGFGLGASLNALLGRATRVEESLLAVVVVFAVAWLVLRRVRRPRHEQPTRADSPHEPC